MGTDTSTEYQTDTISGNVIESEDPNCEIPMLLEYRKEPKTTIWTFAILGRSQSAKVKYVFYVPEGTIQQTVELK